MSKHLFLLLAVLAFSLFSCSSVKLINGSVNNAQNVSIDQVKLMALNERVAHNGQRIGEFVLREDLRTDWMSLKQKMIAFAKLNKANIVVVKTLGWGKKGNGFYADGTLYYAENINQVSTITDSCSVFVVRNSAESPLGSVFTVNVKINDTLYNGLKKTDVIKKNVPDCNQLVLVSINGDTYDVKMDGKSRYFQVAKQTSGNSNGGGFSVGIGGVLLDEIEDEELARLIVYQYQ